MKSNSRFTFDANIQLIYLGLKYNSHPFFPYVNGSIISNGVLKAMSVCYDPCLPAMKDSIEKL